MTSLPEIFGHYSGLCVTVRIERSVQVSLYQHVLVVLSFTMSHDYNSSADSHPMQRRGAEQAAGWSRDHAISNVALASASCTQVTTATWPNVRNVPQSSRLRLFPSHPNVVPLTPVERVENRGRLGVHLNELIP